MTATALQPALIGRDERSRLTLGLLASLLLHSLVVLGLRFDPGSPGMASAMRASIIPVSTAQPAAMDPPSLSDAPREIKTSATPKRVLEGETETQPAPLETERGRRPGPDSIIPPAYYAARDVDVRAVPADVSNRSRQERSMLLGRMVKLKLRLYISDRGTVDRFDVLEAEGLSGQASLEEVYEIRFHPAMRNARPVASLKLVELSFVP
ncbi:MAG: hypothetical protein A3G27_08720 [Betaproteobacteria bacterium RIFCSPLOWO2_12_FULL_66_14]|nr:MAG: hypothetical protein A3G27_08720 [Betaproteobacteria bacterium RIFCSPLOWO2_12_FULL_66_14]